MTNKDKQLTEIKAYREKIEKHYKKKKLLNLVILQLHMLKLLLSICLGMLLKIKKI
ncbi:hypothetical protein [uncultured Gammaproteobacteria bacterium]|nr:hypothetical protein [uncultured Gammaproteobacteria bacterium]